MSVKQKIEDDMKLCMKSSHAGKTVATLRMLLAEIIAGEKAVKKVDPVQCVVQYKKKVEEALRYSPDSQDLKLELDVVQQYCPEMPTRVEVEAFLRGEDRNQSIGELMKKIKTRFPFVDGKMASEAIKQAQT